MGAHDAAPREPRPARPWVFFALAYALSGLIFLPAAAGAQNLVPLEVPGGLLIVGGYGPALAALLLAGIQYGWVGIRELLGRLLQWRFGRRWYAVVLFAPPAFLLVGMAAHVLLGGAPPELANPPLLRDLAATGTVISPWLLLLGIFASQGLGLIGEEVGWRGYALPALQAHWSALAASLVLGVLWGIWHLPLIAIPAARAGVVDIPPAWFLLDITATAVFYTWVYNNTRGSLLAVTLMHTVNNTAAVFLPITTIAAADIRPFLAVVAARWLVVGLLVVLAGPRHLSRRGPAENAYYDRVVASVH